MADADLAGRSGRDSASSLAIPIEKMAHVAPCKPFRDL